MSDIPKDRYKASYYDSKYFAGTDGGKAFKKANGSIQNWSYFNPSGEWTGCEHIVAAWKSMFKPVKLLDVGCGRAQIVAYARDIGIEAEGFDFSEWAIGDEGRYARAKPEWIKCHDATKKWPYPDDSFDLIVALDFYEHIYTDDLDFVISEMYRVASKWIFLQIAVSGTSGLLGRKEEGYKLEKDVEIPIGLEGCAVAGHVTVQHHDFWVNKFEREDVFLRRDLYNYFVSLVGSEIIKNWLLNSILIYELVDD